MDVESRKTFKFGFVLRESDLRRLVDTISDQFRKLAGPGEHPGHHFRLKFRNGAIADNTSLDHVLAQENSGSGRIVRLHYEEEVGEEATGITRVSIEFTDVDVDDEPGYVSIRFAVLGHDRDWVFVTSSLLEERV